jgi:hypothetical protein
MNCPYTTFDYISLLTPIHSYILILNFKDSELLTGHRDVWWGKT